MKQNVNSLFVIILETFVAAAVNYFVSKVSVSACLDLVNYYQ